MLYSELLIRTPTTTTNHTQTLSSQSPRGLHRPTPQHQQPSLSLSELSFTFNLEDSSRLLLHNTAPFMAVLVFVMLVLTLTGHSSATYCICKDGVSEQLLQKSIDYACGAGADCTAILQNGPCFQPNTVKAHCDYAVNSYFQRKGQAQGSCDFSGTATTSASVPYASGGCSYPSSSSTTGTTPTGTTGTMTPGTMNPTTGTPSVFGLGPTGSSTNTGTGDAVALHGSRNWGISVALSLWILGVVMMWV